MAPSIYSPSSNQVQKKMSLFLAATDFNVSGTATLTRGAKGIWYWAQGASLTVDYAANLNQVVQNYVSALINYGLTPATYPNAEIGIDSATAMYLVSTASLTSATLGVSSSVFPTSGVAAAPTVTDLLTPTALPLVFGANLYSSQVAPANNGLLAYPNSELLTELVIVTPASSTFRLYGVLLSLLYNIT